MRSSVNHVQWQFSYIDYLSAFMSIMSALFILTIAEVNPSKNDANAERNAQFVVSAEWALNIDCDIDLWVKDPTGAVVMYQQKVSGLAHLEFDDRGTVNSKTKLQDGTVVTAPDHKEFWTMRGIVPGTYYTSVHLFTCRDATGTSLQHGVAVKEVRAKLTIQKLNPNFSIIDSREVVMNKIWEEGLGAMFDVGGDGTISNIETSDRPLVEAKVDELATSPPPASLPPGFIMR